MNDDTIVLTRHKLDAGDYQRMIETGILGKNDHVELIDGEIIDMAPIGQDHAPASAGVPLDRVFD